MTPQEVREQQQLAVDQKLRAKREQRLNDVGNLATIPEEEVSIGQLNYHGDALRRSDPIKYAGVQRQILTKFVNSQMVNGTDYGKIDRIPKPFLFKQGAEKIANLFNWGVTVECVRHVEDFDKPFFHYVYKGIVKDRSGFEVATYDGSCNSKEKSVAAGMNDPYACNSIMKRAEKRAFVGAVLLASNASSFFSSPGAEKDTSIPDERPKWEGQTIDAQVVEEKDLIISEAQRRRLFAISTDAGYSTDALKAMLATYGIESSKDIKVSQYELICKAAENKPMAAFWNAQVAPAPEPEPAPIEREPIPALA
jgi:hypothetical protein